jgi:hypothetical protein
MSFLKRNLKNALDEKDWTKRDMWYASAFHSMSGAIAHFSEGNEKLSKREWNNWAKEVLQRIEQWDRTIKEHDREMKKKREGGE